MKVVRTPDKRFENLPDFPFEPHYVDVDEIRIHYVDEGPKEASEVILMMHGQPSWCYLYRHMIPPLVKTGFRCVAPDLVGYGRSDKPAEASDYTYRNQINWLTKWMQSIDLKDITLYCQDWGSLIGLRIAIEHQERFKRIILANGGLPTGFAAERWPHLVAPFFRWVKLVKLFSPTKSHSKYNYIFPAYVSRSIQGGTTRKLSDEELNAYEAPFPADEFLTAPRNMPSLVPMSRDNVESKPNVDAMDKYTKEWTKPFLTAFSTNDTTFRGGHIWWQKNIPGSNLPTVKHKMIRKAAHFLQEDKGPEIAEVIINFIKNNP